jgi:hypothetical protein
VVLDGALRRCFIGGSDMKVQIFATALFALSLAPGLCVAQGTPQQPPKPGSINITTRPPEPDKWNAQRSANGTQRVFRCKPLACSDPQSVSFQFSRSPTTRHPDPKALEKFAKVDLPKTIRAMAAAREVLTDGAENIETLKSEAATLKGYPAVINESKFSRSQSANFVETTIIFAGPVMIRVQSVSPNQELAQKALKEFIEAMTIVEGPAPSPSIASPPKGLQSL